MTVTRRNILSDVNVRDEYIEGVKLLKNDFLDLNWPNTYDIFIIWHYYAMMTLTPSNSTSGRNASAFRSGIPTLASLDACFT